MLPLSARAKSVTRRCCLTSQGAPFTVPHETINGASFWKFEGPQLQELLDRAPERAALWALNDADRPGWRPAAAAGPRRVLVRVAASSGGGGEKVLEYVGLYPDPRLKPGPVLVASGGVKIQIPLPIISSS